MADSPPYEDVTEEWQRHDLTRAANRAEWDVPVGRIGDLIRQLRWRGMKAERRSGLFLWVLIGVVIIGLAFYLGLPLIKQYFDGRRAALAQTIASANDRQCLDFGQSMRDIDDADAFGTQIADHLKQPFGLAGRQTGGRFVHDQDACIDRQRLGDFDHLLLTDSQ